MICAFTGHRPQRFPWGGNDEDPRCAALKALLRVKIREAVAMGCRTFLCGMALGGDTYFAEAVLLERESSPELRLEAVLPCPEQARRWPKLDRDRHARLLAACDQVTVLEEAYSQGCMLRRNRAMVDRADVLISVYDGGGGGTGSTVDYARRRGLTLLPVWL